MKVNKIAAFTGIVMALSAGVAQALTVQTTVAISAQVGAAATGCTVQPGGVVGLTGVVLGTALHAPMGIVTNCAVGTPYNITFVSLNGGAVGKLLAPGGCSLNYAITSRSAIGGYGSNDYFAVPMVSGALTAAGAVQSTNFGIRVEASQPNCTLQAGASALATDSLTVSVNY
jgi:hypothetical protein